MNGLAPQRVKLNCLAGDSTITLYRTTQSGSSAATWDNLGSVNTNGLSGWGERSLNLSTPETLEDDEYLLIHYWPGASGTSHQLCGVDVSYRYEFDDDELVYTALEPCVVLDSRFDADGATKLPAEMVKGFLIEGPTRNYSSQGGSATGCGVANNVQAVSVNIVAIEPDGNGTLKVWGANPEPTQGAMVNFIPGAYNSNATIIKESESSPDLRLKPKFNATHARVIVTGYFVRRTHLYD